MTKKIKLYENLLRECIHAFNFIPNQRIDNDRNTTYKLVTKIEKHLDQKQPARIRP